MSWALQRRWLCLNKTEEGHPWPGLDIPIQPQAKEMFAISVTTYVGSGTNTMFWTDRWLCGSSLLDLAPAIVACVSKRSINLHTVAEALEN